MVAPPAKGYTVKSTLTAKTVDAANQLSNLTLTVGTADQTIKLSAGDDLLTFDGVNDFNGNDVISDVSGIDTVRAAFSKVELPVPLGSRWYRKPAHCCHC